MIDIPQFETKTELFDHLVEHKNELIQQKKFEMKKADGFSFFSSAVNEKGEAVKAKPEDLMSKDSLKVKVVINTTNLLDSHSDVHMKGIWNRTVKNAKDVYLLQEHQMKFDNIIASDVKATVQTMTWKQLGIDLKGTTEALVFEANIEKSRNEKMFNRYAKGEVKNHSVGMQYVQLKLCIGDKRYKEERANWDEYISEVANVELAEEQGYFWAVTEAKMIEGSAVVKGSNYATPTLSAKSDSSDDTHKGTRESTTEGLDLGAIKNELSNQFSKLKN